MDKIDKFTIIIAEGQKPNIPSRQSSLQTSHNVITIETYQYNLVKICPSVMHLDKTLFQHQPQDMTDITDQTG